LIDNNDALSAAILDRPLARNRDGCPQGIEWLGLGGAWDTLSKMDPIFPAFRVTVPATTPPNSPPTSNVVDINPLEEDAVIRRSMRRTMGVWQGVAWTP
jgi:hypothetical protein